MSAKKRDRIPYDLAVADPTDVRIGAVPDKERGITSEADSTGESRRLRELYAAYDRSPRVRRRRRLKNLGTIEIMAERDRVLRSILERHALLPLTGRRCLDVGCGRGEVLSTLVSMGAEPRHLLGVDVLPDRIRAAKVHLPGVEFLCADIRRLPPRCPGFDLVTAFTVFSSIPDSLVASQVATAISSHVTSSGVVILYDVRYPNPLNRHLRPVTRRRIEKLFPDFKVDPANLITLAPPVARQLRCLAPRLYRRLATISPLLTHRLTVLIRVV